MGKLSAEGSRPLPVENYMGQTPGLIGQAAAQAKNPAMTSVSGEEQGQNPKPTKAMSTPARATAGPGSLEALADKMHPVPKRR